MGKQMKNKFKSIFVLHVYKFSGCVGELAYQIDKESLECKGFASPGFNIWDDEVGYFQTLRAAEKCIKRIADKKQDGLYSFLIEEKPQDCVIGKEGYLSVRRYLKDGSLWQVSKVSSIRSYDGINEDLGDTGFYGHDLKTIPFKEGDIVEITYNGFVKLAVIWDLPATKERMKDVWDRHRKYFGKKTPRIHPDDTDDSYTTVEYSITKDGKIGFGHSHPAVVDVMPPSLPVPKTYAQQLRKCLKTLKKEEKEYLCERKSKKE